MGNRRMSMVCDKQISSCFCVMRNNIMVAEIGETYWRGYRHFRSNPVTVNVIQVNASTLAAPDGEVDGFYILVKEIWRRIRRHECMIIMSDFNAKIGQTTIDICICNIAYGIEVRNERIERLSQFCIDNDLVIANSLFQHYIR
ncbi:PREDICTED: craniofacial development protein 2-like [Atta colombica]|uniref:craniofacial development protein 2-like n=1 Tax=Atta colombica TaxID=520822 RepID=UPI00084CCE85|nr:PREDICTED: craniofacial development protein 2-like [Atta colombica]